MEVYWQFGGLTYIPGQWNLSPMMHKELLCPEWNTETCKENQIWEQEGVWQFHDAKKQSPSVFLSYQNGTAYVKPVLA